MPASRPGSSTTSPTRTRPTPRSATTSRARSWRCASICTCAGIRAQLAGISAGDQLAALDGLKITAGGWLRQQLGLRPERSYLLHFFRGDELLKAAVQPQAPPPDTWTVTLAGAEGEALARRK